MHARLPTLLSISCLALLLAGGCELLGTDKPDLHVETDRDEFVVGQDTSFSVTLENVSDQSLYYNSCLDVQLEKLHGRRVVEAVHFPACRCLCVTELAPSERVTFDFGAVLADGVRRVDHERDAAYRLRFAFYTDDELQHPLPRAVLASSRFRITNALLVWTGVRRLLVHNGLDRPLAYVVLEEQTAARVDLAPPSEWPHLAAGEQVAIPYDSLMGYDPGDERAVVYWSDEDGMQGVLQIDL